MNNQNINIHEVVYNEIHLQVSSIKRGLLYKVIQIILDEEQSQNQEKTLDICNTFGIKSNASREDDKKLINNLIDPLFIYRQTIKFDISKIPEEVLQSMIEKMPKEFAQPMMKIFNPENNTMEEVRWIIVGACTITGLYLCSQYLKKLQQRRREREQNISQATIEPSARRAIPAELCLIIPEKTANTLTLHSNLSLNSLVHLIDNASYFLCTSPGDAKSKERQCLELIDEYTPSDSERGFYVRVTSSDGGRDLINQEIPYILKRNLPETAQFTVNRLAYLRSFKGLETFNRV